MSGQFIVCKDFYVSGGKILMSIEGINKINEIKIDASKFSYFFHNFNPSKRIEEIEYETWTKIIGFPREKENTLDQKRELLQCNKNIINYLKQQLNHDWQTYSEHKINVFSSEDLFGGVPCGEWMDKQSNLYSSVLSITYRSQTLNETQRIAHFLKLSLYLSLRNLNSGWVCICTTRSSTQELADNIKINSNLERVNAESSYKTINLGSNIPDIGACPFSFKILEEWKNQDSSGSNVIHLIKVEVKIEEIEIIKGKIRAWLGKYREQSPEISKEAMRRVLAKNKW